MPSPTWSTALAPCPLPLLLLLLLALFLSLLQPTGAVTAEDLASLRHDTRHLFYHGYDNYMRHAFPEDELRPLTCKPQTRNRDNIADIGLNDVLGNYSVTLVDSLSTLAILASDEDPAHAHRALSEFQRGVRSLVELYGDGGADEEGKRKCGTRACGFDLDSKVQVFETNIRGVGGLLSAHLFAVGELPIRGYAPTWMPDPDSETGEASIEWRYAGGAFRYNGQLLRLAHDLASRLLPAFSTSTGLPYPRVNLRHGIPFYRDPASGVCRLDGTSTDPREITETCAAGAGSLVLEFTTLSRLTGDFRFERLAKKAFWAVWERRSSVGLIGNGVDAESGAWTVPALSSIGAGVDSFFEYAVKGYVLLSGLEDLPREEQEVEGSGADPRAGSGNSSTSSSADDILSTHPSSADDFWQTWQQAHVAITRHLLRPSPPEKHPYHATSDLLTGAPRYTWIDNLSAYYPGLLALAGHLPEAISGHMLFAALWTRFAALPERWQVANLPGAGSKEGGWIDPNFRHWAGRPEFIESTYYLFQATRDPWYLHVGEMALRDVRRRCWARCGWADLGDVVSGEQRDRMESFFLGETAKYLYLLFTEEHPLNALDGGWVFSTEGHPLIMPKAYRGRGDEAGERKHDSRPGSQKQPRNASQQPSPPPPPQPTCPAPAPPLPLTVSNLANHPTLFHAAHLTALHLVPVTPARSSPLLPPSPQHPGITYADVRSPSNYSFYPWTLPRTLIPAHGSSAKLEGTVVSTLTFPNLNPHAGTGSLEEKGLVPLGALQKVLDGVVVHSLSNLRLNLVQEPRLLSLAGGEGGGGGMMGAAAAVGGLWGREYRVSGVGSLALGRDEKVLVREAALEGVSPGDPHFRRVRDLEMVDLVLDVPVLPQSDSGSEPDSFEAEAEAELDPPHDGPADADADADADAARPLPDPDPEGPENSTLDAFWEELEHMLGLTGLLSPVSGGGSSSSSRTPPTHPPTPPPAPAPFTRTQIPAILPTGPGAAPLPASLDSPTDDPVDGVPLGALPHNSIYYLASPLCHTRLPPRIAREFRVLVVERGGCSFGEKLANLPSLPGPGAGVGGLELVVVVSLEGADGRGGAGARAGGAGGGGAGEFLIRPMLDEPQRIGTSGIERRHPIAMVMVEGSGEVVGALKRAARVVGWFDGGGGELVEQKAGAGEEAGKEKEWVKGKPGLGVKRRYWFESMGVPIGNLIML